MVDIEYKPDPDEFLDFIASKIVNEMPAHRQRLLQYQRDEQETMAPQQKPLKIKKNNEKSLDMIDDMFSMPEGKPT